MSLKETRIKLGKTQAEMARMIGVSERTWIRYEQKTPRPIRLLIQLLGQQQTTNTRATSSGLFIA